MLKIENFEVVGWEHAIRGMRNPKNSWEKSDSFICSEYDVPSEEAEKQCKTCTLCDKNDECPLEDEYGDYYVVGPNDQKLMKTLANGGPVHAKYRRMITVYLDITAPLYWWKEFDTYKVGTVANSCSTMHKIHANEFTLDDFSHEHLDEVSKAALQSLVNILNSYRIRYNRTKDKNDWWQMIQLLPTSYNQKRTVQLNYEVLAGIYPTRKDHKLDEWHTFCDWIKELPYSELIVGEKVDL